MGDRYATCRQPFFVTRHSFDETREGRVTSRKLDGLLMAIGICAKKRRIIVTEDLKTEFIQKQTSSALPWPWTTPHFAKKIR